VGIDDVNVISVFFGLLIYTLEERYLAIGSQPRDSFFETKCYSKQPLERATNETGVAKTAKNREFFF